MKKIIIFLLIISNLLLSEQQALSNTIENTLTIKQNGATSILASWKYASQPVSQEIYLYRTKDNVLIKKVTPLASITSVLFRDLNSEENYRVVLSAKAPEYKISKNIFLYAPPKELSKISYKYQNGYFLLDWVARTNKDIINFKLYENNTLLREFAVSASTAGIKIPNIDEVNEYKIQYFTKNSTGISNKKNMELIISKTRILDIKLLSYINEVLNLEILAENANKYDIALYENQKEISKIERFTNLITLDNIKPSKSYKLIITPFFDTLKGASFSYTHNALVSDTGTESNPLEIPNPLSDDNSSTKAYDEKEVPIVNKPKSEPLEESKAPVETKTKVEDIRDFKIIRWISYSLEENKVLLEWADVFEQEYAIMYRKSSKGAWTELARTREKSYKSNTILTKGFYQFKIVGYVDGTNISESSIRSTVIK